MTSRTQRSPFAEWWWTIDRLMLAALLALILAGVILLLAASTPVASKLGLDPFISSTGRSSYLVPALAIMLGTSLLSPRQIRRLALVVFAISMILLAGTLVFGTEIKGARRWIVLLGVNIQPSEFVKPAFVILIAWLFGKSARKPEMPANTIALGLFASVVSLLMLQPDFGQTDVDHDGVVRAVLHGRDAGDLGGGACRLCARRTWGRLLYRAARRQAHAALHGPDSGDIFQIDNAVEIFRARRLARAGAGRGHGEAHSPDSHADFIFAVAAEEFGIVLCLVVVACSLSSSFARDARAARG